MITETRPGLPASLWRPALLASVRATLASTFNPLVGGSNPPRPTKHSRSMSEKTKRAILKKALDKMGPESLVLRLDTPMAQIQSWLNGQEAMPASKFLML